MTVTRDDLEAALSELVGRPVSLQDVLVGAVAILLDMTADESEESPA